MYLLCGTILITSESPPGYHTDFDLLVGNLIIPALSMIQVRLDGILSVVRDSWLHITNLSQMETSFIASVK